MASARVAGSPPRCPLCAGTDASLVTEICSRPPRETDFGIAPADYRRQILQCRTCTVYFAQQSMLTPEVYAAAYNNMTYRRDLLGPYRRIRALPDGKSDNKQRVRRVMAFHARSGRPADQTTVLDVGSGLCVFLGELGEHGFRCFAVDPDLAAAQHAMENAGVEGAHAGTLDDYRPGRAFDIIAFNKVLEHVPDPVRVLSVAKPLLAPGGLIYIELPDGGEALKAGSAFDREEFYIEHLTVFTPDSTRYLAKSCGLDVLAMEQIHEPSDKYTLYAFLAARPVPST